MKTFSFLLVFCFFSASLFSAALSDSDCVRVIKATLRVEENENLIKERSRRKKLTPVARQLVSRIRTRAQKYINRDLGKGAVTKLTRIISNSEDTKLKELLSLISDEKVELAMDGPEVTREKLLEAPYFQNFHETKKSSNFGPYLHERAVAEANILGMSILSYLNAPNAVKPKYGYLRPIPGTKSEGKNLKPVVTAYGTDTYIFRKKSVVPFATWYFGDSLNRSNEYWSGSQGSWKDGTQKPKEWNQVYLPWELRTLMVLGFENHFKERKELAMYRIHIDPKTLYMSNRRERIGTAPDTLSFNLNLPTISYAELQYWKPDLSLDDVETFEFRREPPSGDFLKELQKRKINIRDGRKWPSQPWISKKSQGFD